LEYATLQRQNDRLKEALVRLRDVTSEQEAEHQRRIKALEKELGQAPDYQNQVTELKGQLEQAETHIEDLKARLDDSMAAEDMVEQLSVRNLDLNEKVEEMKVVIEDLEALKELNDEMEENHVETEKQLQAELEFKDSLLRELQKKLEASDETMVDYEATIQQFRQLVQNLQSDLSDLRSRQAEQQTEAQELTSQSQAMLSLNMQLQSTVMKAQAKAIDLELRKLEAQQATEHLHFLEPYLPATFFQHENNAIRCLLLFKRLAFKSRLLTKQLDPRVEKSDNHITPHYLGTAQLRLGLTRLGGAAAQFVAHLTQCSPDTFLKFGFLYHDVMGIEKRLNTLLDHVRQEEVTPKAVLPEVQRSVHQLETLVQSHLPQPSPLTATETYLTQARALDLQAEVIFAQLILARQTLLASQGSEDSPNFSPEDHTLLHSEFFVPLDSLIQQCKAYKVASTKLLRRVRELGEEALMGILQFGLTLAKYTQEARTLLVDYVANQQEDQTAPELSSIQNRLFDLSEQHLGQTETTLWTCAAKAFNSLNQEMSQVVEAIGEPTALVSYERTDAPWVQRAHQFKAELVLNVEVERKLQALNEEILNLIREVKLKDKALQESGVKIELLEKRMELVKKQADTIAQLEEKIQKGKEQQKMFEEAMEGLQNELEQLELENSKAKKAAARAEKLAARGKSGELDEVANMSSLEVLELKQRVDALASAVSYLRSENVFLKRSQLRLPTAATSTTAPSLPSVVRALEPLPVATLVHSAKTTTPQFNSLVSQTKSLYREVQAVSVSLKVIDITGKTTSTADSKTESSQVAVAPKPATVWQPFKTTPRYAFNAQQTLLNTLHHRSQALQDQVHALQKTSSARLRLPTLVSVASLVR
ncbi:dynein associated protein-domain-containing protein, partial [Dimargaris cristalligena]